MKKRSYKPEGIVQWFTWGLPLVILGVILVLIDELSRLKELGQGAPEEGSSSERARIN